MVYAAVTSDSAKAEWITKRAVEIVTKLQLEKKIHIAGKAAVNPELPAEKLLEKPKLPTLNALAAGGTDGLHPVVPDALAQQWAGRADWLKLLDEIYEEFGPAPTASPEEDGKERASKRRRTETQTTGVETKIQAQPPRELYDADGVLEAGVLVQCPLMNAKRSDVKLVIKQQHQIFLVNQSGNDVKLSAGLILAGFGKGEFKFLPQDGKVTGSEVEYRCHTGNECGLQWQAADLKVFGRQEARAEPQKTEVCYYNIKFKEKPQPDDPGACVLEAKDKRLAFAPAKMTKTEGEDEQKTAKQLHVAAVVPPSAWKGAAGVHFVVRWAQNGLVPVRPQVTLIEDCVLPSKKAMKLS
eukprot:s8284_g5.t1